MEYGKYYLLYRGSQVSVLIVAADCHPDVLNFLSINAALNLGQHPWEDADLRRFLNDPPVIFEGGTNKTKGNNDEIPVEIRFVVRHWKTKVVHRFQN